MNKDRLIIISIIFGVLTVPFIFLTGAFYSIVLPNQVKCENIEISGYNRTWCLYNEKNQKHVDNCTAVNCQQIHNPGSGWCCRNSTTLCKYQCYNVSYYDITVEIANNRTASFTKQETLKELLPITCWLDGYNNIQINCDNKPIIVIRKIFLSILIISISIFVIVTAMLYYIKRRDDIYFRL